MISARSTSSVRVSDDGNASSFGHVEIEHAVVEPTTCICGEIMFKTRHAVFIHRRNDMGVVPVTRCYACGRVYAKRGRVLEVVACRKDTGIRNSTTTAQGNGPTIPFKQITIPGDELPLSDGSDELW